MRNRPLSTGAVDVTRWLAEDRDEQHSVATYVRSSCEARLPLNPSGALGSYIARYTGDHESLAARTARERVCRELHDAICKRAARPVQFGPLQWFLLAGRISRMVSALVELWFTSREFLDASRTRAERAYVLPISQRMPADPVRQ